MDATNFGPFKAKRVCGQQKFITLVNVYVDLLVFMHIAGTS